jgi:hypothetical protein
VARLCYVPTPVNIVLDYGISHRITPTASGCGSKLCIDVGRSRYSEGCGGDNPKPLREAAVAVAHVAEFFQGGYEPTRERWRNDLSVQLDPSGHF